MGRHIFISHAHEDAKFADRIVEVLEARGAKCWIAPRDITPGTPWVAEIVAAVQASELLILVLSRNANESQQIPREVQLADNAGIRIVPVRLDRTLPSPALQYYVSTSQLLDVHRIGEAKAVEVLTNSVAALAPDLFIANEREAPAAADRPRVPEGRVLAGIGIAVLTVGIGAYEINQRFDGQAETVSDSTTQAVRHDSTPSGTETRATPPVTETRAGVARSRPLRVGIDVGGLAMISGTLGPFVQDRDGRAYLLTSVYVTAVSDYREGAVMLQPSARKNGQWPRDRIGKVTRLLPLSANSPVSRTVALVQVDDSVPISVRILDRGPPVGTRPVNGDLIGERVWVISSEGLSERVINSIETDFSMMTPDSAQKQMIRFTGALMAANATRPGETGAIVVDARNRVVGLVVAGSPTTTVIAPIEPVLEQFGVSLLTRDRPAR